MSPINSTFPLPLRVEYIDGRNWRLLETFEMVSKVLGYTVRVPFGGETDFNSIPRFFWRLVSPTEFGEPSIIHDYAYRTGVLTRKQADDVFYEGLLAIGCPLWKTRIMYAAVRTFASGAYKGPQMVGV
jgi:hypothetical protein